LSFLSHYLGHIIGYKVGGAMYTYGKEEMHKKFWSEKVKG